MKEWWWRGKGFGGFGGFGASPRPLKVQVLDISVIGISFKTSLTDLRSLNLTVCTHVRQLPVWLSLTAKQKQNQSKQNEGEESCSFKSQ